jgi:hypothetical protein
MGLKKGQTNNREGRPKGKPNKSTALIRGVLLEVMETKFKASDICTMIDQLTDLDKLRFLVQILPYLSPKKQPELEDQSEEIRPFNLQIAVKEFMSNETETD